MVRRRIKSLKRWSERLPRFIVFWVGVFVGGTAGVLFAIFAFSAFLFQVLQAITTAVLALATVVLALSTFALYHSTRTLTQIELNRERRRNLDLRIQEGLKIVHSPPNHILNPLKIGMPPANESFVIALSIRELRQLINYYEAERDNEIHQLLPLLDLLIMRMDKADNGERGVDNEEDEKTVREWIDLIRKNLKILIARWRGQMPYLYD
jgi:low affinity Fe/Cu permease